MNSNDSTAFRKTGAKHLTQIISAIKRICACKMQTSPPSKQFDALRKACLAESQANALVASNFELSKLSDNRAGTPLATSVVSAGCTASATSNFTALGVDVSYLYID